MVAQVGSSVDGQPPALTEVAIAILFQGDRYLMQLRDDIPTIVYPGQWTFFGGHLEPGESPEIGVWRELAEEIQYRPPWLKLFERRITDTVVRNVFYGPLTVPPENLTLCEGWDLGLWTVADIQRGDRYSQQAQQHRPIGAPHQAILLDFIAQRSTLVPPESAPPESAPPEFKLG
jgi:8-oxo-dGTP pyrophosphatase MutT (NUDIX family)